jgi:glycosyltransferase involved in cell wall biosynthesis
MRIGIDARFLTHPQVGGFKTYTENLVNTLADIDSKNEYFLYIDRPPNAQTKLPSRPNFVSRVVPGTLPIIGMPWREQVALTRQAKYDQLDLLHSPSLTAPLSSPCPFVLTIHDMIWYNPQKYAQHQPWSAHRQLMHWYYRLIPRFAARKAALIITVSHAAKKSIIEQLEITDDHIIVTHEAASPIYKQLEDPRRVEAVLRNYNLCSDFVLAIGSADARKNIPTLLHAYALLPDKLRQHCNLAVVWPHPFLTTELREQVIRLGLTEQVRFLEQVSNDDLLALYNAAKLFAFPSRYEGFGLPLLEAMACGTPVVAANNSSIPEIVEDAALLVDTDDAQGMAIAISQVLSDKVQRDALRQAGLQRAKQFSWQQCARQTLAGYQQAFAMDIRSHGVASLNR